MGHQTTPAPLPEGPPAIAPWKEVLQVLGAMMILVPLAALGLFIIFTILL